MSIYGEGEYECPGTARRAAPAPEEHSSPAVEMPLPALRARVAADPDTRDEAADTDVGLCGDQARPRGALPCRRRGVRHPDGRAPVLQRLRSGTGALEPVHRSRRDLLVASPERGSRRSSSKTGSSRATSSTSATSSRGSRWRSSPSGGRPVTQPRDGASDEHRRGRALLADALGVGLEPERPGSYRTGDIRHCYRGPSARARAARVHGELCSSRTGSRSSWSGSRVRRPRIESTSPRPSSRRADSRASPFRSRARSTIVRAQRGLRNDRIDGATSCKIPRTAQSNERAAAYGLNSLPIGSAPRSRLHVQAGHATERSARSVSPPASGCTSREPKLDVRFRPCAPRRTFLSMRTRAPNTIDVTVPWWTSSSSRTGRTIDLTGACCR